MAKPGRENPVLDGLLRTKKYRELRQEIYEAMIVQVSQFLRTDVLKNIKDRIGKQEEEIMTEKDEEEIMNEVEKEWKPLSNFLKVGSVIGFYHLVAKRGGQAFLDKMKIRRTFELIDKEFISQLARRSDYLIKTVDDTTKKWIVKAIWKGKKERLTNPEIANVIRAKLSDTFKSRVESIVFTETANALNLAEFTTAQKNGATHKRWLTAGARVCPICMGNEGEGKIGINETFSSGNVRPPAHPLCKCTLDYDIPVVPHGGWFGG